VKSINLISGSVWRLAIGSLGLLIGAPSWADTHVDTAQCKRDADITIADIINARKTTNEYLASELRFKSSEVDRNIVDNYYTPTFSVAGRVGKSKADELNEAEQLAQQNSSQANDNHVELTTVQRLPGGGTLSLGLNKDWGRDESRDEGGDAANRNNQYDYQISARQPLLRGAGAAASADLNIGKLGLQQARLSHEVFLQEDLLKTISLYIELISSQQSVMQAQRSLQASKDFLQATQAQVTQGILAISEVDQAQYALSQVELELAYAEQAQKNVMDQLAVFSGIVVKNGQRAKELPVIPVGDDFLKKPFPSYVAEVEMARLNMRISRYQNLLAKNANKPDLSVVASAGKGWANRSFRNDQGRGRGEGWRSESYVGLEFSKTLNDYASRAAMRKAALAKDASELELTDVQLRADVGRATVLREFYSARQYIQLVAKKIDIAKKNLANEQFKMAAGRSTAFFVYSAQSSLAQAESEYIDSTSRYAAATAKLYKERGELDGFVRAISSTSCSSNP
jgi:outer membrane protein TolC